MNMTNKELFLLHDLLKCLQRKSLTNGLYLSVEHGLEIIEREINLKEISNDPQYNLGKSND